GGGGSSGSADENRPERGAAALPTGHLAADGRFAWLEAVPGARLLRPGLDRAEIEVAVDADADAVLAAALAHGLRIRHFELTEASLEEVFIHHVGHPVDVEVGASAGAERADEPFVAGRVEVIE
ncbi:MAG: hypothetical protein C4343_07535, partial [Chloroflexota bacterium]